MSRRERVVAIKLFAVTSSLLPTFLYAVSGGQFAVILSLRLSAHGLLPTAYFLMLTTFCFYTFNQGIEYPRNFFSFQNPFFDTPIADQPDFLGNLKLRGQFSR